MTNNNFLNGKYDERTQNHKQNSNPLNSRTQTAKWIRSTVQTGVRKSELDGSEVIKVVENAVKETENRRGDQSE